MKTPQLNILLVDDEQPARKKLGAFIRETMPKAELREAKNGIEAVQAIHDYQPDLVFLDIQMPGMTGFEVIEQIGVEEMPPVVFVTAYDEYALAAFEVQAIDYLLKPYDQERFDKSFERALQRMEKADQGDLLNTLLQEIGEKRSPLERIMVSKNNRYFFIKPDDLTYISAEEKYVCLHTSGENYLIRDTMSNLEARLDKQMFARIHRSYIVAIDGIREIQPWSHGDYIIVLKNGKELPLSRRYRDRLFNKGE